MPLSFSAPSKRWLTPEQKTAIREGIAEGLSCGEIVRKVGCSLSAAKSLAFREKVVSPKTPRWEEQRKLSRDGKRRCPRCDIVLLLTDFRLCEGRAKYSYCFSCCRENDRERSSTHHLRFQRIVNAARHRATAKDVPFEIDTADVARLWDEQDGRCAYTGKAMTTVVNHRETISLDRVVPGLGYVAGNVVLCCNIVNKMKWDMDRAELIAWCRGIVDHADGRS